MNPAPSIKLSTMTIPSAKAFKLPNSASSVPAVMSPPADILTPFSARLMPVSITLPPAVIETLSVPPLPEVARLLAEFPVMSRPATSVTLPSLVLASVKEILLPALIAKLTPVVIEPNAISPVASKSPNRPTVMLPVAAISPARALRRRLPAMSASISATSLPCIVTVNPPPSMALSTEARPPAVTLRLPKAASSVAALTFPPALIVTPFSARLVPVSVMSPAAVTDMLSVPPLPAAARLLTEPPMTLPPAPIVTLPSLVLAWVNVILAPALIAKLVPVVIEPKPMLPVASKSPKPPIAIMPVAERSPAVALRRRLPAIPASASETLVP